MRIRLIQVVALAVVLTVASIATAGEAASVFPFEGHGTSSGAAAPAPLQWQVIANQPLDDGGVTADFWVIGNTSWPSTTGGDWFFISFTDRIISSDESANGTEFVHSEGGIDIRWNRQISQDGSSVDSSPRRAYRSTRGSSSPCRFSG